MHGGGVSRESKRFAAARPSADFEYLPTMLHAKSIVVDGAWYSIGSYNWDQRRLQYNWELTLSIVDDDEAFALEERFARDLALCREIVAADWRRRPWWQRLKSASSTTSGCGHGSSATRIVCSPPLRGGGAARPPPRSGRLGAVSNGRG